LKVKEVGNAFITSGEILPGLFAAGRKTKNRVCVFGREEGTMTLQDVNKQSAEIRKRYHELEKQIHGSTWSVEEDALAFLTDAALIGRLAMDRQGRWPSDDRGMLPSKIGECVWWLSVLAERMGLSFEDCVKNFLEESLSSLT
jgi:hypothetical protein